MSISMPLCERPGSNIRSIIYLSPNYFHPTQNVKNPLYNAHPLRGERNKRDLTCKFVGKGAILDMHRLGQMNITKEIDNFIRNTYTDNLTCQTQNQLFFLSSLDNPAEDSRRKLKRHLGLRRRVHNIYFVNTRCRFVLKIPRN